MCRCGECGGDLMRLRECRVGNEAMGLLIQMILHLDRKKYGSDDE